MATDPRYRHLLTLASGGMGRVEIASRQQQGFERLYAIKRLHDHFKNDPEFRGMFMDEARVAGSIRHANVVSVLDVDEDDDGPYLVMDFIEGRSLGEVLRATIREGALIPLNVALLIVRDVAAGLTAAHDAVDTDGKPLKVIHRDVSPHNILVGFDGVARLTDFGIAKALGASTHTSTGVVKGKVRYMAPEQLAFRPVDHRADLYSLGVVLFELVSGERMHSGSRDEVAAAVLSGDVPDLGEVAPSTPAEVVALSFRLLASDPDLRPAWAKEVVATLDQVLANLSETGSAAVATFMNEWFDKSELYDRIRDAKEAADKTPVLPPDRQGDAHTPRRTWLLVPLIAALSAAAMALGTMIGPDVRPAAVFKERPSEPVVVETPPEPRDLPTVTPVPAEKAPSRMRRRRPRGSSMSKLGAWDWDHE